MKIADDYLLREILGAYALIPVGAAIDRGESILKLNETGYLISQNLLEDINYDELINKLVAEFDVSNNEIDKFCECVNIFINMLKEKKILTIL